MEIRPSPRDAASQQCGPKIDRGYEESNQNSATPTPEEIKTKFGFRKGTEKTERVAKAIPTEATPKYSRMRATNGVPCPQTNRIDAAIECANM